MLAVVVYQALFLNVLLPGHTRGAITLDGRHTPACCSPACYAPAVSSRGDVPPSGKGPAVPSPRDRDNCAVCHFAVGLTPVLFFRTTVAALGLLGRRPPEPPRAAVSLDPIPTYFACGPPPSPARV